MVLQASLQCLQLFPCLGNSYTKMPLPNTTTKTTTTVSKSIQLLTAPFTPFYMWGAMNIFAKLVFGLEQRFHEKQWRKKKRKKEEKNWWKKRSTYIVASQPPERQPLQLRRSCQNVHCILSWYMCHATFEIFYWHILIFVLLGLIFHQTSALCFYKHGAHVFPCIFKDMEQENNNH